MYSTEIEKHQTKTKQLISLITKTLIGQFLNNAIIYFLLSFRNPPQNYLMEGGLVSQVSNLVIISGLISIPMSFFQIDQKIQSKW
jgi:hypothetical protein